MMTETEFILKQRRRNRPIDDLPKSVEYVLILMFVMMGLISWMGLVLYSFITGKKYA